MKETLAGIELGEGAGQRRMNGTEPGPTNNRPNRKATATSKTTTATSMAKLNYRD